MISDERAEKALTYLAETDLKAAELKADVERCEYKLKAMKAAVFKHSSGTVAERQAEAETDSRVEFEWKDHVEAIKAYSAVHNKRQTEALVIEVWRSVQANRRHG